MFSVVILMSVAASKSSFVPRNSNTQFAAGNVASSNVSGVIWVNSCQIHFLCLGEIC